MGKIRYTETASRAKVGITIGDLVDFIYYAKELGATLDSAVKFRNGLNGKSKSLTVCLDKEYEDVRVNEMMDSGNDE